MRTFSQQKAGLTRAVNRAKKAKDAGDSELAREIVETECARAVFEWESDEWVRPGCWPDDWHRWNIALRDVYPWQCTVELTDLIPA